MNNTRLQLWHLLHLRVCIGTLLFCLITNYNYAQQKELKFDDYNQLIIKYRFYKPDSALYFADKALTLVRKNKDLKGEAIILNHWGIIDENQGRFDLGKQKYLQAIRAYRKINFTEGIADETIRLGVTEMRQANFDKAISYFYEALQIHERNGSQRGIMECYDVLGEAYMGQSNWNTALDHLNKGEQLSRDLPLSGITLYIYNNLGVVYTNVGKIDKANAYLNKALSLSNEPQYAGLHITLLNSLAMVYTKTGQREKAIELQLKALKQAREINNYLRELQTLNGLADNFSEQDPARALKYLDEALKLAKQKNAAKVRLETLGRISKIYGQQKRYAEALLTSDQQHALSDSIFNLAKVTEIANLRSSYQLQRSQNNVERLRHLNKEQKNQQLITIGIAVSVSLILLVLVYYYVRSRSFNKRLSALNAELQASNEVKDKLFSIIGHDLRAPMATLQNFLSLLQNDLLSKEEQNIIVQQLIKNTNASMGVLEQLLNWGQMQIKGSLIHPVDLIASDVIKKNILLFDELIKERSLTIIDQVKADMVLHTDQDHFDIVIRNLLSNAIKFTPDGGTVTIGHHKFQTDGFVAFYINDTGVGMDDALSKQIFGRTMVSKYGIRGEKGTGLGLLLCKEYIEANGGAIAVNSEKGKGTTFTFTMKVAIS